MLVNIYDAISILTLVHIWKRWLINIYSNICVLCERVLAPNFSSNSENSFTFIYNMLLNCEMNGDQQNGLSPYK